MGSHIPVAVWLGTVVSLLAIVAVDVIVVARRRHTVTVRGAAAWIVAYVSCALLFALAMFLFLGRSTGGEFVASYITEYSLSADNLFVFVIIMARFAVPAIAQDQVLYFGIAASLVLRGLLIAAGAAAIAAFSWLFYIFGGFLVYTAVRLLLDRGDDEPEFRDNGVLRVMRRLIPATHQYVGRRWTVHVDGRRLFTPIVMVISAIGMANVVFALDSIPAVFGLTHSAYIVFTANAFAMMGLRQLYFLIGNLLERVVYLNIGLGTVLGFIGVKLILEALHGSHVNRLGPVRVPEIGVLTSLAIILSVLALTGLASLVRNRYDRRHAPDPVMSSRRSG